MYGEVAVAGSGEHQRIDLRIQQVRLCLEKEYVLGRTIPPRGIADALYCGERRSDGRKVFIKIMRREGATWGTSSLHKEMKILSTVRHANIVQVLDSGDEGEYAYIVTEYLGGGTLSDRIREGPISAREALGVISPILDGLARVHGRGYYHLDIKPSNIMFQRLGTPVLTDFGSARPSKGYVPNEGGFPYTPQYASPEQMLNGAVDHRSDIFSVGVVIYELVTGRTPFAGTSPSEMFERVLYEHPTPTCNLAPSVSKAFSGVLARAMAKDPALRQQNCRQLMEELDSAIHQEMMLPEVERTKEPPHQGGLDSAESVTNADLMKTTRDEKHPETTDTAVTGTSGPEGENTSTDPRPQLGIQRHPPLEEQTIGGTSQVLAERPSREPPPLPKTHTPNAAVARPSVGTGRPAESSEVPNPPISDGESGRVRIKAVTVGGKAQKSVSPRADTVLRRSLLRRDSVIPIVLHLLGGFGLLAINWRLARGWFYPVLFIYGAVVMALAQGEQLHSPSAGILTGVAIAALMGYVSSFADVVMQIRKPVNRGPFPG